jgi:hypothetical protein
MQRHPGVREHLSSAVWPRTVKKASIYRCVQRLYPHFMVNVINLVICEGYFDRPERLQAAKAAINLQTVVAPSRCVPSFFCNTGRCLQKSALN